MGDHGWPVKLHGQSRHVIAGMEIESAFSNVFSNGRYIRNVSEKGPDEGHGSQLSSLFGFCDAIRM
ncbi:MAG: hypothetical protein ABSC57_07920, partial [Syntrophales bacterium]